MAMAMAGILLAKAVPHDLHASCPEDMEHDAGASVSAHCGVCDLASMPTISAEVVACATAVPCLFEVAVPVVLLGEGTAQGTNPGRGPPAA